MLGKQLAHALQVARFARLQELLPERERTARGGRGGGTTFLFDAFAEGGWRTPGWLRVPAPTPDEIGNRAYTPKELQPWPTSSDAGGGLLGQPLKTATLSFLRQPLQTDQPPKHLEASVQVNEEWRIGEGPSANRYTHTWAWDGRGHPAPAHSEDGKTLTRSSGLQWVPTESHFWAAIANLFVIFRPRRHPHRLQ